MTDGTTEMLEDFSAQRKRTELVYLASPYSHRDDFVRELRFCEAARHASILMRRGINVFSPIAHAHPIATFGLPKGWDFWENYDRIFLEACHRLVVLMLPGWEESTGVQAEIRIMQEMGKPVEYMAPIDPDPIPPAEYRRGESGGVEGG